MALANLLAASCAEGASDPKERRLPPSPYLLPPPQFERTYGKPAELRVARAPGEPSPEEMAWENDHPKLVSLDGAPALGELKLGGEWKAGDRLVVPEGADARIAFSLAASGAQILATGGSELQWSREGKVPHVTLLKGLVRVLIPKPATPPAEHRFLMRAHSVHLGVRGTDFVVEVGAAEAMGPNGFDPELPVKVHTVNGQVEIARELAVVVKGQGAVVSESHWLSSKTFAVERFERSDYLKELELRQARMSAYYQTAIAAQKLRLKPQPFGRTEVPLAADGTAEALEAPETRRGLGTTPEAASAAAAGRRATRTPPPRRVRKHWSRH